MIPQIVWPTSIHPVRPTTPIRSGNEFVGRPIQQTNKNLDHVPDGTNFQRVVGAALTAGQIDPTKSGFLSLGSRPQSLAVATVYTTTTTSITIFYDGTNGSMPITIYRDDGTTSGPYSGNQTISGLSPSTLYRVYMFFDEASKTIKFAAVSGGVGSPAYAYTSANNNAAHMTILRGHIPLSTDLAINGFTTPASGSGGGSGGGGGGGGGGRYSF